MRIDQEQMNALDDAQVRRFIEDGFIRIDRAFPRDLADEGREILWRDTGCDPHDPATWTKPVIRLGDSRRRRSGKRLDLNEDRPIALATGEAGTVYLCHPFLIHAAQPVRGSRPRFMAQPPLIRAEPFHLHRDDGAYSPVEIAIRLGLGLQTTI